MKTKQTLSGKKYAMMFAAAVAGCMMLFSTTEVSAQVKVGDNPTTINPGSVMELESTNKGLMMPRISLTNTTTWGLAGTAAAGMHVYNTNTGITSSNAAYPILAAKIGEYYWDGTGWVALAPVGSQSAVAQAKVSAPSYSYYPAPSQIVIASTVFDVGNNIVGNTFVVPSTGLYTLKASGYIWTNATTTSPFNLYIQVVVNGTPTEVIDSPVVTRFTNNFLTGTVTARYNAGDVLSFQTISGQGDGYLTLTSFDGVFMKISN